MSIINDALKKVQQSLQHSKQSAQSSPPEAGPQDSEMADQFSSLTRTGPESATSFLRSKEWRDTAILLICFAICIILFLLILHLFRQNSPVPPPQPAPVSTAAPKKTESPPASVNEIIVTGVMRMGTENMALINDEIYEVGEMIDGARIVTIEMDRVEIMKDGKIEILRVRGR